MPQVTSEFYKYDSIVAEMLQQGLACSEIVAKILNNNATREQDAKVNSFRKYIFRHKKRILDQHEGIYNATNNLDVPNTSTKNMWIKNKEASLFVVNPNYKKPDDVKVEDIDFKKLFGEIKPFEYKKNPSVNECLFDRLVYTDTHIAMMISDYSLYGGIWNEDELFKMCDKMISHTIANRKSKVLYIDELGDFLDGYDGQTVRKGHHLPQNMDNQKAFDVGLRFKIKLVQSLIPYYDRIICHNVCEDNHAYIDIPTNDYNDEVFVFDVKEVRIKYFYSTKTLIKEKMTDTTVIVLTDDNELLSKLEITEFIFIFFKDYTEKLKQYFPEIKE
jgi:hypothetical protein